MWKYIKFLLHDEGGWVGIAVAGSMLVSAYMQSQSSGQAADAQTNAANAAAAAQLNMYYQNRADLTPWRQAGEQALGRASTPGGGAPPAREDFPFNAAEYLQMYPDVAASAMTPEGHYARYGQGEGRFPSLRAKEDITTWTGEPTEGTGLVGMIERGPGEFEASPSYNFLLEEGVRARERGASARGNQLSGAQGRALTEYGQNLASTDYDNWLRRYYQSLGPLENLSGVGVSAGTTTAQAGGQAAGGAANALMAGGQAQAAGIMGQQQPYTNLANWGGNQLMNYYMMNQMNQNPGGGGTNSLAGSYGYPGM
ncbi:hypothetical protein KAR91_23110 [Candidatus Pacearchaeota archaeon]|nr:hypothetical protein [Candidatus Pacearchaeota archaeon]